MDKKAKKHPDFKYKHLYPGILGVLNLITPPGAAGPVVQPFSSLFMCYGLGMMTYTPSTMGMLYPMYHPFFPSTEESRPPDKDKVSEVSSEELPWEPHSSDEEDVENCLEPNEVWIVIDRDDTSFKRNEEEDKKCQ